MPLQTLAEICEKAESDPNFCDLNDLALAQFIALKEIAAAGGSDAEILECLEKLKEIITSGDEETQEILSDISSCLDEMKTLIEGVQTLIEATNTCLDKIKALTEEGNEDTEAMAECLDELKSLQEKLIEITQTENDETQDLLTEQNECLEKIKVILDAQEDLDDTDDDVRGVAPQCYIFDGTGGPGRFFGYAKTKEDGSFDGWVVLSGDTPSDLDEVTCETPKASECVESQEWTYGLDNTGTTPLWDATYRIHLSDGTFFDFQQTAQASANSWTPQMAEWGTNIQAAATAAGLLWFVETRFRDPSNPSNLAGGGGFPGPPSVAVSHALTGMEWRYVNIQICPGQPVPVDAEILTHSGAGPYPTADSEKGKSLTTAGAVLGPVQRFFICRACGEAPVWYLADGVTVASAGQIPECYEPCGTLTLTESPPDRECQFFIDTHCDNVSQTNPSNFVNQITRKVTICNGEIKGTEFFAPDPTDATALIPYTLVGDYVDCATGETVVSPQPTCGEFELTTLFSMATGVTGLVSNDYQMDDPGADPATLANSLARVGLWPVGADGVPDASAAGVLTTGPSALNTLDVNDSDNAAGAANADTQVIKGFLVVDEPTLFRYAGAAEGYVAVYIDQCCESGTKELIYQRAQDQVTGEQGDAMGLLPAGIHAVTIINYDVNGTNSSATFQTSNDGGVSFADGFPGVSLYATKPVETCLKVKVCEDTGAIFDLLTDAVLNKADLYACSKKCGGASSSPGTLIIE